MLKQMPPEAYKRAGVDDDSAVAQEQLLHAGGPGVASHVQQKTAVALVCRAQVGVTPLTPPLIHYLYVEEVVLQLRDAAVEKMTTLSCWSAPEQQAGCLWLPRTACGLLPPPGSFPAPTPASSHLGTGSHGCRQAAQQHSGMSLGSIR